MTWTVDRSDGPECRKRVALARRRAVDAEVESARKSIGRIIIDSKRAADIISRIRDLARKAPAHREWLEINEVVAQVIGLTRGEISNKGVSVQTRLTDGLPSVFGDRVQLQQVILNLIMNAIEAMGEVTKGSRQLSISTEEADGVLVAVSDSGHGLPQADPECIFEAFSTTKAAGLGMGLSICRSIVEAHGGRLWAKPNRPRGAILCVTLPIEAKLLERSESIKA